MGYFTARERGALGRSVDERAQTTRELPQDDFAPRRRATTSPDIGSVVQQVSEGPVRKIDAVIAELKHRREAILGESMRMHREMIAYAKLNQSTMDSTRVIGESLANLFRVSDAPALNDLMKAVSDQDQGNGASEEFAESEARSEEEDASRLPRTRAAMAHAAERRGAANE
ncbi:MAG: hypothetical protein ACJ8F3_18505 [Xanthobacteraceae bacterium]